MKLNTICYVNFNDIFSKNRCQVKELVCKNIIFGDCDIEIFNLNFIVDLLLEARHEIFLSTQELENIEILRRLGVNNINMNL